MKLQQLRDNQLEIRCLRQDDMPSVWTIYEHGRQAEVSAINVQGRESSTRHGGSIFHLDSQVAICLFAEEIIGFVRFSRNEILGIYVAQRHQGRGAARRLLRHALENMDAAVDTEVLATNERALTLFFRNGFEVTRPTSVEIPECGSVAQGYLLQRRQHKPATQSFEGETSVG